MSKLLLMSSMAAMVILPLRAARYANPKVGMKRTITTTLLFNFLWGALVIGIFIVLLNFDVTRLYPKNVNGP